MTAKKIAFVLAATDLGPLIVNRLDYNTNTDGSLSGVGAQLLETATCEANELDLYSQILHLRRRIHGDGVQMIDCGANIGTHTIACARAMHGWGSVLAIEAQERIFYALAGNIVLGNHSNARAVHAVVGTALGTMRVPLPNYQIASNFGSLELVQSATNGNIGQPIDYRAAATCTVRSLTIDSLQVQRLDLLKIDVEAMEMDVLAGAAATIQRLHPVIAVEHIKVDQDVLARWLHTAGYPSTILCGAMLIAIYPDDAISVATK